MNKLTNISHSVQERSFASDVIQLIKFRLTTMVVFTSVAAFLIVSAFHVTALSVLLLALGGYLVTGASNAFNQVLEKDFDKLMERTKDRPIAAGRMTISQGVLIAGFMSLLGITVLALFNPLTAFFGMLSLITYSFVYTPLKRHSSIAVVIGAIPGAMPMLIGCVAYEGSISELAIVLFGIQFFWQFAHFWAIAKLGFEEYEKAGFSFLPKQGDELHSRIGIQSFLSTVVLIGLGAFLGFLLQANILIVAAITIIGLVYMMASLKFWRDISRSNALKLMFASIIYLPVLLISLLINQMI